MSLIAGNWKMFKGPAEAAEFCRALREVDLPDDAGSVAVASWLESHPKSFRGHQRLASRLVAEKKWPVPAHCGLDTVSPSARNLTLNGAK